jgi:hypothetical protein
MSRLAYYMAALTIVVLFAVAQYPVIEAEGRFTPSALK